jgi:hypothetical protein
MIDDTARGKRRVKVDLDYLALALEDSSVEATSYLDVETPGDVESCGSRVISVSVKSRRGARRCQSSFAGTRQS